MDTNISIKFPECPTCYNEFSRSRVCYIICANGHSICETCNKKRKNQSQCPVCREPELVKGGVINRSMMDMIEEIQKAYSSQHSPQEEILKKPQLPLDKVVPWKLYCREGDIEEMKQILANYDCSSIVNTNGFDDNSVLTFAIIHGKIQVATLLLDHGAKLVAERCDACSIIMLSCQNIDMEMIKLLFERDVDEVLTGDYIQDAFNYCCEHGYLEIIKLLIHRDIDINHRDGHNITPLMRAAKNGHYETLKYLLDHEAEVNDEDINNRTALNYAAEYGVRDSVDLLLQRMDDVTSDEEVTPLMHACERGDLGIVRELLLNDVEIEYAGRNQETALIVASREGHDNIVEELFECEPDLQINCCDSLGNTALMYACSHGWTNIVGTLLRDCTDLDMINMSNKKRLTALMLASQYGYLDIVELLLLKGAHISTSCYMPEVMLACIGGHTKVVEYLLDQGADVESFDDDGRDMLSITCNIGNLYMAQVLLEKGLEVNIADINGVTPLMIAGKAGHFYIIELLLKYGANLHQKDFLGRTAFMLACKSGQVNVLQLLYTDNSDINIVDQDGDTSFIIACEDGNIPVISWLLDHDADVTVKGRMKLTGYHMACARNKYDVVRYLVERYNGIHHIEDHIKGLYMASVNNRVETVRYLLNVGIPVNSVDENGITALMCACQYAQYNIVKLLIENGADIHMTSHTGATALLYACTATRTTDVESNYTYPQSSYEARDRSNIISLLLEKGAKLECRDENGRTPLLQACKDGHLNVIKTLLHHNANIHAEDKYHNNLILVACEHIDKRVLQYILSLPYHQHNHQNDKGCTPLIAISRTKYHSFHKMNMLLQRSKHINMNIQDNQGETAVIAASARGDTSIVRLLLRQPSIDVNLQDKSGKTALMHAARDGHLSTVQALVEHGAKIDIINNSGETAIILANHKKDCTVKTYDAVIRYLAYKLITTTNNTLSSSDSISQLNNSTIIRGDIICSNRNTTGHRHINNIHNYVSHISENDTSDSDSDEDSSSEEEISVNSINENGDSRNTTLNRMTENSRSNIHDKDNEERDTTADVYTTTVNEPPSKRRRTT